MNKVKFLIATLGLALFAIIGCEKDNQLLSPAGQAGEEINALDKGRHPRGQVLYAVTSKNRLIQFDSKEPDDLISRRRITGLQPNERILGIDFRPAGTGPNSRGLYALGSSNRLYLINPQTGVATAVGAGPFTPGLQGTVFGFDFNPTAVMGATASLIRVVSDARQNLRLNPDNGMVVNNQLDGQLAYAAGDANADQTPLVAGAAYTNPAVFQPGGSTTLYVIDVGLDILATQAPPNAGVLNTVGPLGRNVKKLLGFDIVNPDVAYAVWAEKERDDDDDDDDDDNDDDDRLGKVNRGATTLGKDDRNNRLVQIELTTGKATKLGKIDTDDAITGLAAPIP